MGNCAIISRMQVILTHENADFDAIASLLGASRLFPQAVPVLPRRINRNVQAFLTLYGEKMPFRDPDSLPRGQRIQRVILVDTQGLTSVRGMPPKPRDVLIVDHHTPAESFPEGWRFQGERLGATTTLLVEAMAARLVHLEPIEATLLLAGIYEDTGNLTYAGTTARDLRAAAWLLEQGASLDIVMDMLEHGLTEGQLQLYKALEEAVENFKVYDYTIIISAVQAPPGLQEEISTLAHRLRDTLAPDALFVLVGLGNHIQMVARSTNAAINVADVVAAFGGSGHERAAAALIRDRSLDEIVAGLKACLQNTVRPPITVRDLMSTRVHMVLPDEPIQRVQDLMLRTGHEGVPVRDRDGHILGLVTRKAVDHALQHGMATDPVSRIMEPGSYVVAPGDSAERVRQLMIESGWGQIPVVENGKVLGVITRTDLIRLLPVPPSERERRRREIEALMAQAFPAPLLALVRQMGALAADMGYGFYFVGGIVRDLLLGYWPIVDIDFVVEGDAIALAEGLVTRYGGELRTHRRFGTAKWMLSPDIWRKVGAGDGATLPTSLDLVTARTEFYENPTALPLVEWSSIKQDLHRRDFTINTLAIRLSPEGWGDLLDFYGGERDLRNGILRVLHSLSFVDDPTRILRAARFEARLGFRLDERSARLIQEALPMLNRITGSRIRHELDLIFKEAHPEAALARLNAMGVLAQLAPGLALTPCLRDRFVAVREELDRAFWGLTESETLILLWALFTFQLDADTRRSLAQRFMLPHRTAELLERVAPLTVNLGRLPACARPSEVVALLQDYPAPLLALAWLIEPASSVRQALEHYWREWRHIQPELTGEDLKKRGLAPGPGYRHILETLRFARLDGLIHTRAAEEAMLETLLSQQKANGRT